MRKQIAILCLAIFCFALFVAVAHAHGAIDLQCDCTIMLSLSFTSANSNVFICLSRTRSIGPSSTTIIPEALLARLDARAPQRNTEPETYRMSYSDTIIGYSFHDCFLLSLVTEVSPVAVHSFLP